MSDQSGDDGGLQPEDLDITFEGGEAADKGVSPMGPRPDQRAMGPRPDQRAQVMGPRPDQGGVMGPRPDQGAVMGPRPDQGVQFDVAGFEGLTQDLFSRLEAAVARIEAIADRLEQSK